MCEPGSLAGLSGVEKAEDEVSELKTKLKDIADEITALKTKLKRGASILKDKTEAPWTCEKLDSKLPDEEYDVVWTEEDCHNPLGKFVGELKAEIAKKEDKEKDLTALLSKMLLEKEKQVTAEKEKEAAEARARQGQFTFENYPHARWFNSDGGSTKVTEFANEAWSARLLALKPDACPVCGTTKVPLTRAHILRHQWQCRELGLEMDETNFLWLCGTKGEQDTCHHMFDYFYMSFQHVYAGPQNEFEVIGGLGLDGKFVEFNTCPHKRALDAHLTSANARRSLKFPVNIDWQSRLRNDPSTSPGVRIFSAEDADRWREIEERQALERGLGGKRRKAN